MKPRHSSVNYGYDEGDKNSDSSSNNDTQLNQRHVVPIVHTEKTLEEAFDFTKPKSDNALKSAVNYMVKYYRPSGGCMKNYLFERLPIFDWVTKYDLKENFVKDLIAGITVRH